MFVELWLKDIKGARLAFCGCGSNGVSLYFSTLVIFFAAFIWVDMQRCLETTHVTAAKDRTLQSKRWDKHPFLNPPLSKNESCRGLVRLILKKTVIMFPMNFYQNSPAIRMLSMKELISEQNVRLARHLHTKRRRLFSSALYGYN